MFNKSSSNNENKSDPLDVLRPTKGSAKVIIGNGVKLKGEITEADEIQIDGVADVVVSTDNLVVGSTGDLKGTITSHNADVWGKLDGDVKISGTLTVQEQGAVSGNIEYQSLQIKLGGSIRGEIKVTDKVKKLSDVKNKSEDTSSLQSSFKEQKTKE